MIKLPSYLKRLPTKKEIDYKAEFVGYDGYIPYTIVTDIYCMLHHKFSGTEPSDVSNDYIDLLKSAVSHISIEDSFDFLHVTMSVLKILRSKINFRKVEQNKFSIVIDKDNNQKNYSVDLEIVSKKIFDVLDVELLDDLNSIQLTDDIIEILEFQNGITSLIGNSIEKESIIKTKMSSYSQITKARKYRYALPSIKADIALKRLNVKIRDVVPVQHDKATIMIDRSFSTASKKIYRHLVKAVLLTFLDKFQEDFNEITIIEFTNLIIGEYKLTSIEEIETYIRSDLSAIMSINKYKGNFKHLNSYHGDSIFLLTDGTADFSSELSSKIKWNILSLESNVRLSHLSSISGGKFIKM